MHASNDQIYLSLGALTSSLEALQRNMEEADRRATEGRQAASASRSRLYARMDEVGNQVTRIESRVEALERTVSLHAIVVGEVEDARREARGMWRVTRWVVIGARTMLVAAGGGAVVALWDRIVAGVNNVIR